MSRLVRFVDNANVPSEIILRMLRTPYDSIYIFTNSEIKSLGLTRPLKLAGTDGPPLSTIIRRPLTIGVAGPMSGQYRGWGKLLKDSVNLALESFIDDNRITPESIKLIVGDDKCGTEEAIDVAKYFSKNNVDIVIGHFCSNSSIAASRIYNESKIIQISPASGSPDFTDNFVGNGVFRIAGRDDRQTETSGLFLVEKFAGQNVAFIDDGSAYGKMISDQTRAIFEASGGQPVFIKTIDFSRDSISDTVSILDEKSTNLVFFGGYGEDAETLLIEMRKNQVGATFMGVDALLDGKFKTKAHSLVRGTLMTFHPDFRYYSGAQDYYEYVKREGLTSNVYPFHVHAALTVWLDAIVEAKSLEFDDVVQSIHENRFSTILGDIYLSGQKVALYIHCLPSPIIRL